MIVPGLGIKLRQERSILYTARVQSDASLRMLQGGLFLFEYPEHDGHFRVEVGGVRILLNRHLQQPPSIFVLSIGLSEGGRNEVAVGQLLPVCLPLVLGRRDLRQRFGLSSGLQA
jgi:hypothetical protein